MSSSSIVRERNDNKDSVTRKFLNLNSVDQLLECYQLYASESLGICRLTSFFVVSGESGPENRWPPVRPCICPSSATLILTADDLCRKQRTAIYSLRCPQTNSKLPNFPASVRSEAAGDIKHVVSINALLDGGRLSNRPAPTRSQPVGATKALSR